MTLVGSEKRQIRKCFMLISMEISLIYRRLLPGSAWRALPGPRGSPGGPPTSPSAAARTVRCFPAPALLFLAAAASGFLSHDGFIGPLFS